MMMQTFMTALPDWPTVARAVHVLSIMHWIGGLAVVTTIVLPAARREPTAERSIAAFESFERRFAAQARWSVFLAGLSGFYMFGSSYGWHRISDPSLWWLHLMVAVWSLFAVMLYVLEPLFLHDLFLIHARTRPKLAFDLAVRFHAVALTVSAATIAAGVLGAHGAI
jgi:uncharacterized membrane protein